MNRWALFTIDELIMLKRKLATSFNATAEKLLAELNAEIEMRKNLYESN